MHGKKGDNFQEILLSNLRNRDQFFITNPGDPNANLATLRAESASVKCGGRLARSKRAGAERKNYNTVKRA